jgi:hypothetical protein
VGQERLGPSYFFTFRKVQGGFRNLPGGFLDLSESFRNFPGRLLELSGSFLAGPGSFLNLLGGRTHSCNRTHSKNMKNLDIFLHTAPAGENTF